MDLRHNYKQTDVGVIPDCWEVHPLGYLAQIQRGASPRPIDSPVWYDSESLVGWVRISDIAQADGKYLTRTRDYLSEKGIAQTRFLPSGTLIMSICATVGVPVITSIDACIHDGFVSFTKLRKVDTFFLYYKLKELEDLFKSMGQTGSQSNLNSDLVRKCLVALPPLHEQEAIGNALSDMDALISSQDKLIAKKRDIMQATMQQLLTGKTRLPGFSKEWEPEPLGKVFEFLNTANNPRSDLSEHGEIEYIHYGDIHTKWHTFLDCARQELPLIQKGKLGNVPFLQDGDLVIADASEDYEGIGISVEVKNVKGRQVVAGLHTFLLRGNNDLVADGFKGYLQYIPNLRTSLRKVATGISVYGISKNNVKEILISLPSPKEQQAIAAILSDMDAEIEALKKQRSKTNALKQGMMQQLLTGKTRII